MLVRSAFFLAGLLVLFPNAVSAQGIFEPFGFPKTVTATGHTEVLGSVHVALRQGPVGADTLVIDVSPFRLTNGSATDIQVTTSGNITVGAVTIEAAEGRVRVPVNAGATTGSFRVDGIRVSLAGLSASSVTAQLSWAAKRNVLTPRESVVVVDQVQAGLVVDRMTDGFLIFNSVVLDNSAKIVMREGYNTAFVSGTDFGQDTPTRIRIRVTDFPAGVTMEFPATVQAGESGSTITTTEGTAVTLPRQDGSAEVTYNFTGAGNSADVRESFSIPFTVGANGIVGNLQPTIELGLAPIGAAVPSSALPATNIPRFEQDDLVAVEGTSRIITKVLYWTGIDNTRQNRISIFNPSSRIANLIVSALTTDGQSVNGTATNGQLRVQLGPNQSYDQLLTDVFGATAANIATVRIQSPVLDVVALGTVSGPGVSESTPFLDRGIANFTIPSPGEDVKIHIFNPGTDRASGSLTLRTAQGVAIATEPINLDAGHSITRSAQDLFKNQIEGQITGSFTSPVVAFESFGGASTLNLIPAQVPVGVPSLFVPFFATGGGYETELSLINSSDQVVTINAQVFDTAGTQASAPKLVTLTASQQVSTTIAQLFQLQRFTSGYVRIEVPPMARGFWVFYPAISGHARIRSTTGASTVMTLSAYPQTNSFVLNSGVESTQFQGIAIVNPNASAATVSLQALSNTGTLLSTATLRLGSGQISSKLTSEYFSNVVQPGSVIRVTGSEPLVTTSITGSLNGEVLRAAPGLR